MLFTAVQVLAQWTGVLETMSATQLSLAERTALREWIVETITMAHVPWSELPRKITKSDVKRAGCKALKMCDVHFYYGKYLALFNLEAHPDYQVDSRQGQLVERQRAEYEILLRQALVLV